MTHTITRRRLLATAGATVAASQALAAPVGPITFGPSIATGANVDTWNDAPVGTAPILDSTYVFVRNITQGVNYYGKAQDTVDTPNLAASTAKFMTALLLVEYKGATLSSEYATVISTDLVGGTNAGLIDGDVLSLADLHLGLLVPSGNDAANTIARYVGTYLFSLTGSGTTGVARFVERMNSRAVELGMAGTTYETPHGIGAVGPAGNTITARSLARIANKALLDPTVQALSSPSIAEVSLVYRTYLDIVGGPNQRQQLNNAAESSWSPVSDPRLYTFIKGRKGGEDGHGHYSHGVLWQAPNGDYIVMSTINALSAYQRIFDETGVWYKLFKDFPALAGTDAPDEFLSSTVLLTGANTVTDDSSYGRTLTLVGGATASTSVPIIGSHSYLLNGTTGYVSAVNATELHPTSGDFTIEVWIAGVGSVPGGVATIASMWDTTGNQREWLLDYNPSTNIITFSWSTTGSNTLTTTWPLNGIMTPTRLFDGTPRNITVDKHAEKIYLYFDGNRSDVGTAWNASNIFSSSANLLLGAQQSGAGAINFWPGKIDEVRITIDQSRYWGFSKLSPFARPWSRTGVPVTSSIELRNRSGVAITNYPLQFGRPFLAGEIPNFPKCVINGTPTATQADVKNTHGDGSWKYGVIATVVPTLPADGSPIVIEFINQATGNNTPTSKAAMLAGGFDFGATKSIAFVPWVRGVPDNVHTTVTSWKAITDGSLAASLDGGAATQITGLNFSGLNTAVALDPQVNAIIVAACAAAGAPWVAHQLRGAAVSILTGQTGGSGHTVALATPTIGTNIGPFMFASGITSQVGSGPATASARTMLTNDDYSLWTSGSIAQTIELADDTTGRAYDIGGADGFHPLRPRFYATFWPGLNKVQLRYVGQTGLTTEGSDLFYQITLTRGNAAPTTIYTHNLSYGINNKYHWSATQWTKQAWHGGTPSDMVDIDFNIAYMRQTNYFPNYGKPVRINTTSSDLGSSIDRFDSYPNDIYDGTWNNRSNLQGSMPAGGGRDDLGQNPLWSTCCLVDGSYRHRRMMLTLTDVASSFPFHYLETDTARRFNRNDTPGTSTGLGKPVSTADRRTFIQGELVYSVFSSTAVGDRITNVGPILPPDNTSLPWIFDGAHQPSYFYTPYILTGDPYYLRELHLIAGFSVAYYSVTYRRLSGRGGGIADQLRGAGRVLRNRIEAAHAAPDGTPEKTLFTLYSNDALAAWEGYFRITGTAYDSDPVKIQTMTALNPYSSGFEQAAGNANYGLVPPLHNWESHDNANSDFPIFDPGTTTCYTQLWMQWHCLEGIARAVELGYAAEPLLLYTGSVITEIITNTNLPKLIWGYACMSEDGSNAFATSWQQVVDAFTAAKIAAVPAEFVQYRNSMDRHPAASIAVGYLLTLGATDSAATWAWYKANVLDQNDAGLEPRCWIWPRIAPWI